MILNILVILIGAVFLAYGIQKKLKFWIVVGAVILGLGAVSAGVDFFAAGNDTNDINNRLPFVINGFVK